MSTLVPIDRTVELEMARREIEDLRERLHRSSLEIIRLHGLKIFTDRSRAEAHKIKVEEARQKLAWMRANGAHDGCNIEEFAEFLAVKAKHDGLYRPSTNRSDICTAIIRLWKKAKYYESDDCHDRFLSGYKVNRSSLTDLR